jgi:outer membrane receptor protein involved in Fe transport
VHTGVTGQYKQLTSGNPDLVPEVAQNLTAGIVYKPSFIPRFSISVDYYQIKINNAISTIVGNPLTNQLCESSGGTSVYCALFVRPFPFDNHTAANFMTAVYGYPENIAVLSTKGIDIEANYSIPLGAVGNLALRGLASYQPHFWYQPGVGQVKYDQAGAANATLGTGGFTAYGSAKWKANFNATYALDRVTVNLSERYRGKLKPSFIPTDIWTDNSIAPRAYTDLGVTYRFGGDDGHPLTLFVNVQNLLNQKPAIYTPTTGVTVGLNPSIVGGDDVVGRYFTGGVRLRF